jgi:hypothetical protein
MKNYLLFVSTSHQQRTVNNFLKLVNTFTAANPDAQLGAIYMKDSHFNFEVRADKIDTLFDFVYATGKHGISVNSFSHNFNKF